MEKENKEEKSRYSVVEVSTQTAPMIEDAAAEKPENKYLTIEQALVQILNKLDNMEEKIVG